MGTCFVLFVFFLPRVAMTHRQFGASVAIDDYRRLALMRWMRILLKLSQTTHAVRRERGEELKVGVWRSEFLMVFGEGKTSRKDDKSTKNTSVRFAFSTGGDDFSSFTTAIGSRRKKSEKQRKNKQTATSLKQCFMCWFNGIDFSTLFRWFLALEASHTKG